MLATFSVTSNSDSGAGIFTEGELRWAIDQANTTAGADTIVFQLPGSATTIALVDPLDSIIEEVVIDGTTQPGYLTAPIVAIDGSAVSDVGFRLAASASGSTIKALSIYGFQYTAANPDSGNAIVIDGSADGNEIDACFIGTDASSTTAIGNAVAGILVRGTNTTIRNSIISGNGASGVILENDDGTTLTGNRIGTDRVGAAALANAAHGILLRDSANASIGGATAASRNVISGNAGDGIRMEGATAAIILGNYIGVDALTGAVAVANGGAGISLDAVNTTIGNGTVGGRNVISGNSQQGILVRDGTETVVQGNYIGASASGTVNAGNVLEGIRIDGGSAHLVGGTVAGMDNVISANGGSGVRITTEATDVTLQQNLIGLGTTLKSLGNGGDGVSIDEASGILVTFSNRIAYNAGVGVHLTGASGNLIGADATRPAGQQGINFGNAIYANAGEGVLLETESNDNIVSANLIGLATPNGALQGNGLDGISIQASRRNVVGGPLPSGATDPVYGNVVAANLAGISIVDADAISESEGNVVRGNQVRNNTSHGILLDNVSNQTIGGALATDANAITLNAGNGVEIRNGSRGVVVTGNYVGTTISNVLGFGNAGIGIRVLQSNESILGGDAASGFGNIVVGNASDGIVITRVDDAGVTSGDARRNVVYGNIVRANKANGIRITSASDNFIGNAAAGFGNTVGNNKLDGMRIETAADGNTILGNTFGGPAILGNGGLGIRLTASYENIIGSSDAGGGNSLSRNIGGGILIDQSLAVDLGNGNLVVGNEVDSNLGNGITLAGSSFQTIGGAIGSAGTPGNVVTRNRGVGIRLVGDSTVDANNSNENLIRSNLIGGTDKLGASLGNTSHGIELVKGSFNVLQGNTVDRNAGTGIRIDGGGGSAGAGVGADNMIGGEGLDQGNVVIANKSGGILIENDSRRNSILGDRVESNVGIGINVRGSQNTTIGGGTAVVRSTSDGIVVTTQTQAGLPVGSSGTIIEAAYAGTDSVGSPNLGNQGVGIRLSGVAGVIVGSGTVAASNRLGGIRIENSTAASLALGNAIRGTTVRDNLDSGIIVMASGYQSIGGTTDGYGNTISRNRLDGIALSGNSKYLSVQANTVSGNLRHGISLSSVNDTTIDGLNVVVGNTHDGVNVSSGSTRNTLAGNSIGQMAGGEANGNKRDGVGLYTANGNTLSGNTIGSNLQNGVTISAAVAGGPSVGNLLQGNLIQSNVQIGVNVLGSRNQVIGGTGVGQANTVTANGSDGIFIGAMSGSINVIGNFIGTDATGADNGNTNDGIEVNNSLGMLIRENTIRFNDTNGLRITAAQGTAASPTLIQSNTIRSNDGNGIQITASAFANVGRTAAGNTIGENKLAGVRIDGAATANTVEANFIGTNPSKADLGNGGEGVLITGALNNVVRGGNTISFNSAGVRILDAAATTLATGNRIESNLITGNDAEGVVIAGGALHSIGGTNVGNTITLNGTDGVAIVSSPRNASAGNRVRANYIGTDKSQAAFGNLQNGIKISGGRANTVDQNIITDNAAAGVAIAASSGNTVGSKVIGQGNQIIGNGMGVSVADTDGALNTTTRDNSILGNTIAKSAGDGVTVTGAKTVANIIGASTVNGRIVGAGNTIRDNVGFGVLIASAAQQASMQANSIYDNTAGGISLAAGSNVGGATPSVSLVQLVAPSRSAAQLAVTGTIAGVTAGQQYQLDVFASRPEDGSRTTGTGYGGRTFLGRATVTASANGTMSYSIQVPAAGANLGDFVTVMSTNLRPPAPTSSAFSAIARTIVLQSPANTAVAGASLPAATTTTSPTARSRATVSR